MEMDGVLFATSNQTIGGVLQVNCPVGKTDENCRNSFHRAIHILLSETAAWKTVAYREFGVTQFSIYAIGAKRILEICEEALINLSRDGKRESSTLTGRRQRTTAELSAVIINPSFAEAVSYYA